MHSIFSHRPEGVSKKSHLMPIACGRSFTPAGHFFAGLLLLFLFLFLPACGGTSGGGGGIAPFDVSPVTELTVIPNSGSLQVSWTNPQINDIARFDITWQRTRDASGGAVTDAAVSGMKEDETGAGIDATYRINDVLDNHVYTISVTVLVANGDSATERLPGRVPGPNRDNDIILDAHDNCPTIANSDQSNQDEQDEGADPLGDACDVDDDGDGLIEIRTAAELNNTRHNLAGTGYRPAAGEEANSVGCPDSSGCIGYELTANISLAGMDWIPIGGDADDQRFTADFDGNGNVISNVTITNEGGVLGNRSHIGFFAGMNGATIKNLGLVIKNFDVGQMGGLNFGGLSGRANNTEIMNSYLIFSDVISLEISAASIKIGGLIGLTDNTSVERVYVVLPNNVSIKNNLESSDPILQMGGIIGDSIFTAISSINNSYVIYRGDIILTTTQLMQTNLSLNIGGFGPIMAPVENSYAFFEGNYFSVTELATNVTVNTLPTSVRSSYFNARTDTDHLNYRTLPQLRCPTGPDATCDGATTYADWDASIWDFGDEGTLPTLRGIPPCPAGYPYDECRFGSPPE